MRSEARVRPSPAAPTDLAEARAGVAQLGRREFQERLAALGRQQTDAQGNPGSYASTGCERCANCMFCKGCDACYQCTHCVECELCHGCTHCVECKTCHGCAYCNQSENCSQSAYLVLSRNMSDCTYCFGCTGLTKKDFHILNVPFGRTEYFEVTARLRKELGLPVR